MTPESYLNTKITDDCSPTKSFKIIRPLSFHVTKCETLHRAVRLGNIKQLNWNPCIKLYKIQLTVT